MKTFAILLLSFLVTGCSTANKHIEIASPVPNSREALLPDFEPTGSPCTDYIQVNMLNVGCTELTVLRPEPTILYMACTNPQPGATDDFSTKTWVFISSYHPSVSPPGITPVCGDNVGTVAISLISINELTGISPTLEHPLYEGDN